MYKRQPLYGLFTGQVEALRAGDWARALALREDICPAYRQVLAAIGEG